MAETQVTETTVATTTTEATHEPQQEERKHSLFTDILTIIGFVILFVIIIWGIVHLIELISSSFSSSKPAPTIQVNAPAQATSGQPVTISWNYTPSAAGSYAFLYECQSGLTFDMQASTTNGTSATSSVPCGVAYSTATQNNSLIVTPILSSTSSISDTLSIVFIPSQAGSQVLGNAAMTVNPAAKPVPVVTRPAAKPVSSGASSYSSSSYGGSGYSTTYSGPADLAVSIISGNINANGYGTVTFNIANVGGSPSGTYEFSAQLPTAQPYPYTSPIQAPLAPGAHVVSTLNFTDAASGGGLFTVSINAADANSADNYASMQISGPYNYNGYNNSSPYVQYPQYTY